MLLQLLTHTITLPAGAQSIWEESSAQVAQ